MSVSLALSCCHTSCASFFTLSISRTSSSDSDFSADFSFRASVSNSDRFLEIAWKLSWFWCCCWRSRSSSRSSLELKGLRPSWAFAILSTANASAAVLRKWLADCEACCCSFFAASSWVSACRSASADAACHVWKSPRWVFRASASAAACSLVLRRASFSICLALSNSCCAMEMFVSLMDFRWPLCAASHSDSAAFSASSFSRMRRVESRSASATSAFSVCSVRLAFSFSSSMRASFKSRSSLLLFDTASRAPLL
mmetsp:Transcript_65325/g.155994  ORF Transcript_65325/g.155994 Transcript_65325/m.155994 type:complete len:255 (-) Transcript_65325:490-1254(-)